MNKTVTLLVCLLLLAGCKDKSKKDVSRSAQLPSIDVSTPEVMDVILTRSFPGYLSSDKTVSLVARVDGTLQESYLVPGKLVNQGDLIFVIEPTLYENDVQQCEAQLVTAKAQYAYAKSNYERMKEAAVSGAVSEIQVLEAESTLKEQEASIQTAEAELSTAKTNLSYCYIRAPFSGRVTVSSYDVGNYISGSAQAVTLATLYKDDFLYAYFNVEESQYLQMADMAASGKLPDSLRNKVGIVMGDDKGKRYPGVLDYLSPNVDTSTGTLTLRAKVDNPKGALKSGLYVFVLVPYSDTKDALLIRDASIGTDQSGKYVYLVNDSNEVVYRHVEVGELVNDTLREITRGMQASDYYVKSALLKVHNGMKIKPVKQ